MLRKIFEINEEIYKSEFILKAIEDYSEYYTINFINGELIIEGYDNIDEIFNEFMNYVIGLINE